MNFSELAENIGLEEDEFLELVKLFVTTTASDLNKLQSAIDERNMKEVIEVAHSIKGASGNLGFQEMYDLTQGIEMNARKNSLDGAWEALKSLKEKFSQIENDLKSISN
jgi:HPt (histidine-containing phosphotransfer) domain-containing protein